MNSERGSEWRKWDLHVHTPESFEHHYRFDGEKEVEKYDNDHWAKYLEKLEEVTGIDALGITDYMTLDGYERVVEAQRDGRLDNFELVLPNIEFRLDTILDEKRINMHVIFDGDELDIDTIRHDFLHNIKFTDTKMDDKTLRKRNIRKLGKEHKVGMTDKSNLTDLQAGYKIVTVPYDRILDELDSSIFEGNYLIVLAMDGWDSVDWGTQVHGVKERLFRSADALFSGSDNTIKWALGEKGSVESFEESFGEPTPCLWGSDAHDYNRLCNPDDDKFCWIKSDLTFQGLKQVIHEPKRRVHIGSDHPRERPDIHALDEVKIQNGHVDDRLEIDEHTLPLNRDLVTVIGGKGAGKTALLDLIANSFKDRWDREKNEGEEPEDQNSFIQRIQDKKPEIKTTLEFSGDEVEAFSKQVDEEVFFEASDVVYLPQGKIEEYCRDDERLHNHILDLITESVKRENNEMVERLESRREDATDLAEDFRDATSQIYNLNPERLDEELDELKTEKNHREGDLEAKGVEIATFRRRNEEVLNDTNADDLRNQLEDIQDRISQLEQASSRTETVEEDLAELSDTNETLEELEADLEILGEEITLPRIQTDSVQTELDGVQERISDELESNRSQEEKIEDELAELGDTQQKYSRLLDEREEIKQDIDELEQSITDIENKLDRVEDLNKKRRKSFRQYVLKYSQIETQYQAIIDEFADQPTNALNEITFEPLINVDEELHDDMERHLDMRSRNSEEVEACIDQLKAAVDADTEAVQKNHTNKFFEKANELGEDTLEATQPLEYEGTIFGDHLSLGEEIYFRDSHMQNLSLGQKGTVLLKILLFENDTPLIIDQPEENLDNEFIYETLVDSFRDAKDDRQVIIATHNANLVVNTDAEQIITAKYDNDDNTIKFDSGALENPDTRDDITTILEGSEEAFRRRQQRYELSKSDKTT